jgi:hypothetical protein
MTSKAGQMNELVDMVKKGAAVLERLGATSVRTLTTTDQLNTVMLVSEAESREAVGRLQDRFFADAEGAEIFAASGMESSPLAAVTTLTYFDI